MTLEVIDNLARLGEIRDQWWSIAQTITGLTPFQIPEWLITWWSHFGTGGRLHVLVFREENTMVGIIPCFRHQWNGRRQITLLGSGISDYLEPAIQPQYSSAILDRLRSHLETDSDWDICNWQDLYSDTPLRRLESNRTWEVLIGEDTECSEIPLTGSFGAFWEARPKHLRQNLRRDKKRAEIAGGLQFETAKTAEPEFTNGLLQLHAARWQRRGEPGVIAASGSAEFLRDIVFEFARLGILEFFSLRFRGKIAAIILSFVYANTIFFYLSGFDPEQEAMGFGRILLFEALRHSHEKKYNSWNFLRGNEAYKYYWGAQRIPKCRLIVTRTS